METETTTTTDTAAKRLVGFIDPHLFNTHILAASKDDTRKALKGINFRVMNGFVHVGSTDGRVLLHTVISPSDGWTADEGLDVIVEARKIPCGARDTKCYFRIDGNTFEITTGKGKSILPLVPDLQYPTYWTAEIDWEKGVAPLYFAHFDPAYLAVVKQYIGDYEYRNEPKIRTASETDSQTGIVTPMSGAPHSWRTEEDDVTRTATLMPLRI